MVAVNATPFPNRFKMTEEIKALGIKNGDIFFRQTDTTGPFGIPFSTLVAFLSNSSFSHAAIARVEGDEIYLLEVTDRGVVKERLLDWLDYCVKEMVYIYRLKDRTDAFDAKVTAEIDRFFREDFDYNYNYTYGDPNRYYCTQAVAVIYENCGVPLMVPMFMKDILKKFQYAIFKPINKFVLWCSGKGFSDTDKYYFVGTKTCGMLASPLIEPIYKHNGTMTEVKGV